MYLLVANSVFGILSSHGSVSVFGFSAVFFKVGSVFGIGFFKYRISVRFFG